MNTAAAMVRAWEPMPEPMPSPMPEMTLHLATTLPNNPNKRASSTLTGS